MSMPSWFDYNELCARMELQRNGAGQWLCGCGAVLEADKFVCQPCAAATALEAHRRAIESRLEGWRAEMRGYGRLSGVPDFGFARLDNPEFTSRIKGKKLLAAAAKYSFDLGPLIFSGPTGCGKTTVMVAMLHRIGGEAVAVALAQKPGSQPTPPLRRLSKLRWTDAHSLVKARRMHPLGAGEAPLIEGAFDAEVLVVDELGFEPPSEVIFEIADHRYRTGKPTLLTSGLAPAKFAERYGDACFRRFAERGAVVGEW
jgi:DNA replication protein DnaC